MSLKTDLKAALKANKLSMSTFNKKQNKQAKKAVLEQVVRAGIAQGYSREKLSKELRSIRINDKKFTFSNEAFRDIYDFASFNKGKLQAGRLRGSAKPRESKLFNLGRSKPLGGYLYVFKAYLVPHGIKNPDKKLPRRKSVIKLKNTKYYSKTQEIAFYLPVLVNGSTAKQKFLEHFDFIQENSIQQIPSYGSDKMGIPSGYELIAYEYIRVVRDF